jgi:fatty-acyl-CoA synthase
MNDSPAKAWARALQLTAPIAANRDRILPTMIDEVAAANGDAPAVLSDSGCLSYGALVGRSNQYARWAIAQGVAAGDVVCLLMPNRPDYLAAWLGITRVGGVVALLNTNLTGRSLGHCINVVSPAHAIIAEELAGSLASDGRGLAGDVRVSSALCVDEYAGEPLEKAERRRVTVNDRALYIYTSGTTGLPKAAAVSHARLMQWSRWFAGLMNVGPADRMYNCLPMYHSVGGVLATGAMLSAGGSVVVRDRFSARQFWSEIRRWDCTLFQYIGELCRYLLHADIQPHEAEHRLRMCCGNGLRADIWETFKSRFRIPQILEFYASTEGNVSLFNVEGKPGAVGRVPPFLRHRFPAALVRFSVDREEPVRNDEGFCIRTETGETGEAIGPLVEGSSNVGAWFEGYTSGEATEKKILRDVFRKGDAWFRTGDLMRTDTQGYFYFVDRIGDTFRWKGENVATSEVSEVLCAFDGIEHANVYGVAIPGADGRAGMATVVAPDDLDLAALRAHLTSRLPVYAIPVFLRIRHEMDMTGTFKYTKSDFVRQGFDPCCTPDAIYFDDGAKRAFVRLDEVLYDHINAGRIRI